MPTQTVTLAPAAPQTLTFKFQMPLSASIQLVVENTGGNALDSAVLSKTPDFDGLVGYAPDDDASTALSNVPAGGAKRAEWLDDASSYMKVTLTSTLGTTVRVTARAVAMASGLV